jgi:serine/threonine-protein kinase HipA
MKKRPQAPSVLTVFLDFGLGEETIQVGRLAKDPMGDSIVFQASESFVNRGLNLSPVFLDSRSTRLQIVLPKHAHLFFGLHGVFGDSLPDGWGLVLMDRDFARANIVPGRNSGIERLSWMGRNAMGALCYEPEQPKEAVNNFVTIESLAEDAENVIKGNTVDVLNDLTRAGGSSAGARPKVLLHLRSEDVKTEDSFLSASSIQSILGTEKTQEGYTPFLIKFRGPSDSKDDILIEYAYNKAAIAAGLDVPKSHILVSSGSDVYFAVERFDRDIAGGKKHFHSAAGLLHSNFRLTNLEYADLVKLALKICQNEKERYKLFRLACFNVFFFNRDDHAKNFGFLMDKNGQWTVSPAYDLTFCKGPGGEHSTTICGEGKNPTSEHLKQLAKAADLNTAHANMIIEQVQESMQTLAKTLKELEVSSHHDVFKYLKLSTTDTKRTHIANSHVEIIPGSEQLNETDVFQPQVPLAKKVTESYCSNGKQKCQNPVVSARPTQLRRKGGGGLCSHCERKQMK